MAVSGDVHWSELMTRDVKTACEFLTRVVGWRFQDFGPGAEPYKVGMAGDRPVCGVLPISDPEYDAIPTAWVAYVHVDDVDASCAEAERAGGSVARAPIAVAGVGRIAIIRDGAGTPLGLITPDTSPDDAAGAD